MLRYTYFSYLVYLYILPDESFTPYITFLFLYQNSELTSELHTCNTLTIFTASLCTFTTVTYYS
jgi:hypothetical protein